jgi:hypothetical protein
MTSKTVYRCHVILPGGLRCNRDATYTRFEYWRVCKDHRDSGQLSSTCSVLTEPAAPKEQGAEG